jgi:hypothetical protein
VFEEMQRQCRAQPGNPGQQPDNHNRTEEVDVAAAHGVDQRIRG